MKARDSYYDVLLEAANIREAKREDYSEDNNPYSNFEFAADFAGVSAGVVFRVLQGVKIARILQLHTGKTPNNESLADSKLDLINYIALELAYEKEHG